MTNAPQAAQDILSIIHKAGCTAQVTIMAVDSRDIKIREGQIEQLLSSIAISTGVRIFKGHKSAIVSFSGDDFSDVDLKLKTALETVDLLGEDPAVRLTGPEERGANETIPALILDDEEFDNLDSGEIASILVEMEKAGLAVSPRMTAAETADFTASHSRIHVASSAGLAKSFSKSLYTFMYNAVADENGSKEVDYWNEVRRFRRDFADRDAIIHIGRIAAERALKRLGGRKISSGERPVLFSPRVASSMLSMLADALDGEYVLRKNSFLADALNQNVFTERITIVDNPLENYMIGSYPFDGEGVDGKYKIVVDRGRIATFLHNSYSAGKLGASLTGNASHSISRAPAVTAGNLILQPGQGNLNDLMKEMNEGLLVEGFFSSGMNEVTGDFSFGCSGYWVEKGDIVFPVKEITIAGNMIDLFRDIVAIGDDNRRTRSISSPSFLVRSLAVAGH